MSNDDGLMLMNFDVDGKDQKNISKPKISGGRWKDRRKIIKVLEGNQFSKRKRDDNSHERNESDFKKYKIIKASDNEKSKKQLVKTLTQGNPQIISSLFTSNRKISTSVNTNAHNDEVEINPSNAPLLKDTFDSLGISNPLLTHLIDIMKISKPTKIQKFAIPSLIHSNNDLFIHAQTGSGKTLSFLLPILTRILNMEEKINRDSGCFAMFITPTRELSTQVYQVLSRLCQCCHYLVPCLLIGGERKKSEKARLRKGTNFIIGTPGRILDHLKNTKVIKEKLMLSLRYLVLDEGDKLMELGFENTITEILSLLHEIPCDNTIFPKLPSRIIHILCSATLKGNITQLGNVALQNYKLISSDQKKQEITSVPDQLLQQITIVPPKLRLVTLAGLLNNLTKTKQPGTTRTIVFLSCSDSVDFHFETFSSGTCHKKHLIDGTVTLLTKGNTILPCFNNENDPQVIFYKLHGSLSQKTRSSTLHHFSTNTDITEGKHLIMFCTDIASRGLDLPYVYTIIEMDPPFAIEDHLHRIGRTARAGVSGQSLLFLLPGEEEGYMDCIKPYHPHGWKLIKFDQDILKDAFQNVEVKKSDKNYIKVLEWDSNATTWHLNVERRVLDDPTFKTAAVKGYLGHIRAYATHLSQEKKFFNLKCLHLGHLAKSFALRERPKSIHIENPKQKTQDSKVTKESSKSKMLRLAYINVHEGASEFNY